MEQEEKEITHFSETENIEVVEQENITPAVENNEENQEKKTTKNLDLKKTFGGLGKKFINAGKSIMEASIGVGKNFIDKAKLEIEFKKLCNEITVHMIDSREKAILANIDTENKLIYTKDLIKLKDIKSFEYKKLGKFYYILNLRESKESISINFKGEEHPYEVYAYEYTQEKAKEDIPQPIYNIANLEQNSIVMGKNSVIGNNNDTSKSTIVEVSPTVKLK